MGRELLQLADTYNPAKHKIAGHWISEKLDGTRCFWDGGVSRGCRTEDVPWAGIIDPKNGERKKKIKPYATGLWSRYGNPIMAPDEFLNSLPCCPLDGELWAGRGNFQLCRSICGGDEPDPRFHLIKYAVYSSPAPLNIFQDGEIKHSQMICSINCAAVEKWMVRRLQALPDYCFVQTPNATFNDELMFLREFIETQNDTCYVHQQVKLPDEEDEARVFANNFIEKVLDQGGEGAVIRDGKSRWMPKRHKGLLKFKPYEDSEAVVIGYRAGKEGKQGNVLGKIGTLLVRWGSIEFEIGSGLTFEDREFRNKLMSDHAAENPAEIMPLSFDGKHIGMGDTITFKYRELTDDGIPKEARYWRKRDKE